MPENITTTYTRDALYRLTQIGYSDGTPTRNFQYDMSSGWNSTTLSKPKGRLTYAYTGNGGVGTTGSQFGYDLVVKTTWLSECAPLVCGTSTSPSKIVYAYNYLGDVISMLDEDNNTTLSYAYNTAGQLTGITTTQSPSPIISSINYNPPGQVSSASRADGTNESYSYDNRLRMTNHSAGSYYSLALGYDASSDVTSATDSINGTWTYGYSGHFYQRLLSAACTANCANGWGGLSWTYDLVDSSSW
jgi:YD repeat-containing protein